MLQTPFRYFIFILLFASNVNNAFNMQNSELFLQKDLDLGEKFNMLPKEISYNILESVLSSINIKSNSLDELANKYKEILDYRLINKSFKKIIDLIINFKEFKNEIWQEFKDVTKNEKHYENINILLPIKLGSIEYFKKNSSIIHQKSNNGLLQYVVYKNCTPFLPADIINSLLEQCLIFKQFELAKYLINAEKSFWIMNLPKNYLEKWHIKNNFEKIKTTLENRQKECKLIVKTAQVLAVSSSLLPFLFSIILSLNIEPKDFKNISLSNISAIEDKFKNIFILSCFLLTYLFNPIAQKEIYNNIIKDYWGKSLASLDLKEIVYQKNMIIYEAVLLVFNAILISYIFTNL